MEENRSVENTMQDLDAQSSSQLPGAANSAKTAELEEQRHFSVKKILQQKVLPALLSHLPDSNQDPSEDSEDENREKADEPANTAVLEQLTDKSASDQNQSVLFKQSRQDGNVQEGKALDTKAKRTEEDQLDIPVFIRDRDSASAQDSVNCVSGPDMQTKTSSLTKPDVETKTGSLSKTDMELKTRRLSEPDMETKTNPLSKPDLEAKTNRLPEPESNTKANHPLVPAAVSDTETQIKPKESLPYFKHFPTPGTLPKKGLVLGGGGAKGCYHVGAWQAFAEHGLFFDAVSGTSIGALVGSFYVQQNIEAVTDFVMGMTPTEIARELPKLPITVKEKVKGSKTILEFLIKYKDDKMDITPLKNHFENLFDYQSFAASPITYACMTYNDTRQEARPFVKEEITPENAQNIIMASAACYPAFPKVEMDGELYMDGGYADNVPIELLLQNNPLLQDKDITVIDIHGPGEPIPPSLTKDMFYIQPLLDPGNSIDFSTEHATRLYNQGYLETLKYLEQNPGYLYTFRQEDASLLEVMEQYLDSQMEQHQIVLPDSMGIPDNALSFLLGYTPFSLDNKFSQNYEYGKLIEALGLMARVEPVALYDYRDFLKLLIDNLSSISLTNVPSNDFRMLEMLTNLKRDELTVQLHKILVSSQGKFPSAIEKIKDRIAVSYTLAYIWYFAEELVKNLA